MPESKAITVVVGGRWHSPDLVDGLTELGFRCLVVDPTFLVAKHPISGRLLRLGLRVANRFPAVAPYCYSAFTRRARRYVLDSDGAICIAWSGFAREIASTPTIEVVVVRGSSHIRSQRRILEPLRAEGDILLPTDRMVRREEREYDAAVFVTVPTEEIAADPAWGDVRVLPAPYGIDQSARGSASPPDGGLTAVFVGEVGLRKGADRLKAFDEVAAVASLNVVGKRSPGFRGPLPRKAVQHGQKPHAETLGVIADSHLMVLLSREEGMARVGLEALASGVPLLVTRASGLGSWCNQGAGVVVSDDASIEELSAACKHILDEWPAYSAAARDAGAGATWRRHAELIVDEIARVRGQAPEGDDPA